MDDLVSRWASAMVTWLITFTLIISQVESQSLRLVRWSPHTAAAIGQSVTLACVFNRPAKCAWNRGDRHGKSKGVIPGDGYSYDADYRNVFAEPTKDCSLTIDAVKSEDLTMWSCVGRTGSSEEITPWTYITQQVVPSLPIIQFNNETVSSIELPSSRPPSQMVCISSNGNPAPSLHWEVNGRVYRGKLLTMPVLNNLYTAYLRWDQGIQWQTFDNVSEITCKANHPGFTNTMVAKIELKRQYAPRTDKTLTDGFTNDNITIGHGNGVQLVCIADGHPQPTNYTWELWSDQDKQWKSYIVNEQNISVTIDKLGKYKCKASNRANQHSPTTSINQLTVSEQDGTMANVIKESNGLGFNAIVAIAVGVTLIITNIIFATCVIRLRRKLSIRNEVSSTTAMAQSNAIKEDNIYMSSPVSGGATNGDVVLYDDGRSYVGHYSVSRTEVDASIDCLYEEIRDKRPIIKGQGDYGYTAPLF